MKDKKMLYGIVIAFVFLLSIGLTYAYFSVTTNVVGDRNDMKATTMDLGNVEFKDGNEINGDSILPGWSLEKTFTIENSENATTDTSYAIVLEVSENTLTSVADGAFIYSVTGTSNNSGRTIKLVDKVVPATIGKNVLSMDGLLHAKDLHSYTFKIEFVETNEDQNVAQGKKFSGFLQIELVDDTGTKLWDETSGSWSSNVLTTSASCFQTEQSSYIHNEEEIPVTQINGYYDNEENDITKSLCPRKVIIPPVLAGYDVWYINTGAFSNKNIESVILPETTTMIYDNAFKDNKITNLVIPDSVMNIAESAFENNGLTSLDLGEGVTFIGTHGFYNNDITTLVLPDSLMGYGYSVFESNKISKLTLGSVASTVGEGTFKNNEITSLVIPNSVAYIGNSTFENNKISSLSLGSGLSYVADYAFRNNNIGSFTYANPSTTFGTGVFSNNKLINVTISNSTYSIPSYAYANNSLTSVTIPNPVSTINDYAFYNNKLTSATISDTVTSIGASAFEKNLLTSVTIPSLVTTIDSNAFKDNKLTSIIIPESVINLGSGAFSTNELTYACIKGKSGPGDFGAYDASAWTDSWAGSENIIWNCTY